VHRNIEYENRQEIISDFSGPPVKDVDFLSLLKEVIKEIKLNFSRGHWRFKERVKIKTYS
jgi:hypothetical protein